MRSSIVVPRKTFFNIKGDLIRVCYTSLHPRLPSVKVECLDLMLRICCRAVCYSPRLYFVTSREEGTLTRWVPFMGFGVFFLAFYSSILFPRLSEQIFFLGIFRILLTRMREEGRRVFSVIMLYCCRLCF